MLFIEGMNEGSFKVLRVGLISIGGEGQEGMGVVDWSFLRIFVYFLRLVKG